jgi:hypothetical protein
VLLTLSGNCIRLSTPSQRSRRLGDSLLTLTGTPAYHIRLGHLIVFLPEQYCPDIDELPYFTHQQLSRSLIRFWEIDLKTPWLALRALSHTYWPGGRVWLTLIAFCYRILIALDNFTGSFPSSWTCDHIYSNAWFPTVTWLEWSWYRWYPPLSQIR